MDHSFLFKITTAACLALSFASTAYATHVTNYTIWDNINDSDNHPTGTENQYSYWGGDSHRYEDVIGSAAQFDIQKAVINHIDNQLTVDIHSGFISNGGIGSYTHLTSNGEGIGLGDLFFTTTGWNPTGIAEDHYNSDNLSNTGTTWNYVLSLGDNRWDNSGDAILYEILDNSAYLTSDAFLSRGTFRNGQLIAVDRSIESGLKAVGTGSWGSDTDGVINFLMDIDSLKPFHEGAFGLHWGMTCGNDVIEGDPPVSVPEPAAVSLLGLGLIGLGVTGFRKRNKKS